MAPETHYQLHLMRQQEIARASAHAHSIPGATRFRRSRVAGRAPKNGTRS